MTHGHSAYFVVVVGYMFLTATDFAAGSVYPKRK